VQDGVTGLEGSAVLDEEEEDEEISTLDVPESHKWPKQMGDPDQRQGQTNERSFDPDRRPVPVVTKMNRRGRRTKDRGQGRGPGYGARVKGRKE
jgi:hypothetical protein